MKNETVGTIVRINAERKFGFIKPDGDRAADHFFHIQGLAPGCLFDELKVGDRVSFSSKPGEKGPRALDVAVA